MHRLWRILNFYLEHVPSIFWRYFTFVEGSSFDDTLGGVKEAHFWSRVIDLIRSFDDPNDSNDPLVRVSEN